MDYKVTEESFASLASYWAEPRNNLNWSSIFVLPTWMQVWWLAFGSRAELRLYAVQQGEKIVGIAPLLIRKAIASIVGNNDVCDYLDFVVVPGKEDDFFTTVLNYLRQKGITQLDLKQLRPDSTVFTNLLPVARRRKYKTLCHQEDVSLALDLPSNWNEYLRILTPKQRHEVERKLRRLQQAGKVEYQLIEDNAAVPEVMDIFFKLFRKSSPEKASFMTSQMESFFRSLAEAMTKIGLLRLGILKLDTLPTAAVMAFDYKDCVYLYNSSFDPAYRSLSVGLLSKVLLIKDSIRRGRKRFDFLKGGEIYKYHLGGREISLHSCQITIKITWQKEGFDGSQPTGNSHTQCT